MKSRTDADIELIAQMLMFPPGCTEDELPMDLVYELLRVKEVEGFEAMHRRIRQYMEPPKKKEPQEIVIRIVVEQQSE